MADEAKVIDKAADNIRLLAAAMVEKAKCGHPGGAMGGADYINILFSEFLATTRRSGVVQPRFSSSGPHVANALRPARAFGHVQLDDLKKFRQWGSDTPGHPNATCTAPSKTPPGRSDRGTPWRSARRSRNASWWPGSANGWHTRPMPSSPTAAFRRRSPRAWAGMPDTSGSTILFFFYDSNDVQLSTMTTGEVSEREHGLKYQSWGWRVIESSTATIRGR